MYERHPSPCGDRRLSLSIRLAEFFAVPGETYLQYSFSGGGSGGVTTARSESVERSEARV